MNHLITTRESLTSCIQSLARLPLDRKYVIRVDEAKSSRTQAQNALYHSWLRYLEAYTGDTLDKLHTTLRAEYLAPIYLERPANKRQRDWAALFVAASEAGMDLVHVMRQCSTTWANTKQFTQYLEAIEGRYQCDGVMLPHPEDRYYEAMGVK